MSDPIQGSGDPEPATRRQVWSKYWVQGALHSLSGSFAGNYEGSIREFWLERFAPLLATDRVLDVGTGNGPLPALLCQVDRAAMPRVDAIDVADVDPAWLASAPARCREAIRFHSGTSVEDLPFADASFDLVASQYGFEYAALDRAVPEIARALKPGGRLAVVVHHAASRLADVAREELRLGQWLLAEGQLLAAAADVVPYMAMAARGERELLDADAGAAAAREALNTAMRALAAQAAASPCPDLLVEARGFVGAQVEGVLRHGLPPAQAREALAGYAQALQEAGFRNRELLAHALDQTGIDALCGLLRTNGFTLPRARPLCHDGHLVGWTVEAVKAAR